MSFGLEIRVILDWPEVVEASCLVGPEAWVTQSPLWPKHATYLVYSFWAGLIIAPTFVETSPQDVTDLSFPASRVHSFIH